MDKLDELKKDLEDEKCLIQEHFKREQKKEPHLRSNGALICCKCKKCNPGIL